MIPLPALWKWLWINFVPVEEGEEGPGLLKDDVVTELLKEIGKEGNVQAGLFAKALIGRYLCLMYKNSTRCKTRFTDPSQPNYYTIKRNSTADKEDKAKKVPPFPADSRVQILKELREEKLGRTSARNLLQLMKADQSPTKKARTGDGPSNSQGSSSPSFPVPSTSRERSRSSSPERPSTQERLSQERPSSQEKLSQDEDTESQGTDKPSSSSQSSSSSSSSEGSSGDVTLIAPPAPEPKERRGLKRAASSQELGSAASASPSSPVRGAASPARRDLPTAANPAASGHAAAYRALRKQVSSPVLTTPVKNAPSVFYQQEPWKREINDLWAKQLAMMREINTLKAEMGRREAARQREVLTLRQEIDLLRGELRNRPANGLKPPLPPPREDPSLTLKKTGSVMSLAAVVAAGEEEEKERAKEKEREREKEREKARASQETSDGKTEKREGKEKEREKKRMNEAAAAVTVGSLPLAHHHHPQQQAEKEKEKKEQQNPNTNEQNKAVLTHVVV